MMHRNPLLQTEEVPKNTIRLYATQDRDTLDETRRRYHVRSYHTFSCAVTNVAKKLTNVGYGDAEESSPQTYQTHSGFSVQNLKSQMTGR